MGLVREKRAHRRRNREAGATFDCAELQGLGAGVKLFSKTFGTIPPKAVILFTAVDRIQAYDDGPSSSFTLDLGDGTSQDNILDGADIDAAETILPDLGATFVNGGVFTATIMANNGAVDLQDCTQGICRILVVYTVL